MTNQLSSKNYYRFSPKAIDESEIITLANTNIGLFETIGGLRRRYSVLEDVLISFIIPQFANHPFGKQQTALKATVASLQTQFGMDNQGSTLNGTIVYQDGKTIHAITTNVGDSMSFMVLIENQKVSIQLLNTLHLANAPTQEDKERIQHSKAAELYAGRLCHGFYSLALTHAIGDNQFADAISHEPDITMHQFQLQANTKAYLLVACDGLTENNALTNESIAEIVLQFHTHPEKVAYQLAKKAIDISTDNVSVAFMPITNSIPIGIFVFDGHGGSIVSNQLGNHFYDELLKHIT